MTKTTKKTKATPAPGVRVNLNIEFELPANASYTGITPDDIQEWVLYSLNDTATNFRISISRVDLSQTDFNF